MNEGKKVSDLPVANEINQSDLILGQINGSTSTFNIATLQHAIINPPLGSTFSIDDSEVLSKTTLGDSVVNSNLTGVGELSSGSIKSSFGDINLGSSNLTAGYLNITSESLSATFKNTTNSSSDGIYLKNDSNEYLRFFINRSGSNSASYIKSSKSLILESSSNSILLSSDTTLNGDLHVSDVLEVNTSDYTTKIEGELQVGDVKTSSQVYTSGTSRNLTFSATNHYFIKITYSSKGSGNNDTPSVVLFCASRRDINAHVHNITNLVGDQGNITINYTDSDNTRNYTLTLTNSGSANKLYMIEVSHYGVSNLNY